MDAQIESHLPLISHRIIFAPKAFPPPAVITARMEFPGITISHRELTPPLTPDPKTASKHGGTPRRENTPNRENGREKSVLFEDDIRHLSPLTENSEGERSDYGDENRTIKKPRGGPGRPGGKGYTLQTQLDWSDQTYERVVSLVHKLTQEKLDPAKSYRSQDKKEIKRICERATKEYSFLRDYENDWPIRDMILSRLKYTSESARRKGAQKKTKEIENILTRSNDNVGSSMNE